MKTLIAAKRTLISRRRLVAASAGLIALAGCGSQQTTGAGRVSPPAASQDSAKAPNVPSEPATAKVETVAEAATIATASPAAVVPEPAQIASPEPAVRQAPPIQTSSTALVVPRLQASDIVRPRLKQAPELISDQWINSEPLSLASLSGSPFMVEFWTFGCYNCTNVLPSMKAWYEELHPEGFEIVAVHSPEFSFEKVLDNVKNAVAEEGIEYPVAIDNSFGIWRAYGNQYWPTMYLVDREGWIRYVHIGEGRYDETRQAIVDLLLE